MKMILAERLLHIMKEQQINQVELAAVAGCTKGRINQILRDNDATEALRASYGFKIAERYGYEPKWVITGEGPALGIAAFNHRAKELLNNYARCDERGRTTILTVAEREAQYTRDA